jgi:hypothetical protein
MSTLAEYFHANRYQPKYFIGDRVFGYYNKIPFIGSVGNDTLINPEVGPQISIHLDLPIHLHGEIYSVIIVKHKDIKQYVKEIKMSHDTDKFKHSTRIQKENNVIKKQQKIAKANGMPEHLYEGHRFAKHNAMDCGNPGCPVCSNPRRLWNELTTQEKRQFQDVEIQRMRHSNGIDLSS